MRVTSLGQAERRLPVLEEECIYSPSGRVVDDALRLLARMLVAAARQGPINGDLRRASIPQNQLDVSAGAEVMSKRP